MKLLTRFACATMAVGVTIGSAVAQTTVKWLHIEQNPGQVKIWEEVARQFEAKNPGTRVEMQFLENEAYKAKAPTLLQSRDRPHIIYSWAGGVLEAQVQAGVLEDITAAVTPYKDNLAAGAVQAFTIGGKVYGLPHNVSQVGFIYNKDLLAKANVDGTKIKTWNDLLEAVKTLKAAGITPLVVGGADKWPLHFYWTHLAVRLGGKPAFEAALKGEQGGFASETYLKAGELMKQLVDLQPFQTGFLGFKNQQALGFFGDGRAAMSLAISSGSVTQRSLAADKKGIPEDKLGWFDFPMPDGAKAQPTDTLGGVNGWLITKGAPKEAVEFVKFFVSDEVQRRLAAQSYVIPTYRGAEAALVSPFMQNIARNIAASQYHQNFYDQALGPSVGRVVNDVSAEIAGGTMSPREAALAVQEAWRQGN